MNSAETIVVKIGSTVTVRADGRIDYSRTARLMEEIISLKNAGYSIVAVTAGAVAAGALKKSSLKGVPKNQQNQFYAAIGQPKLLEFFSMIASQSGENVAQILVSRDGFANRTQYFNIRDTLRNLLNNSIIPIVNDNDILHKQEPDFSDNDHLASYIGGMLNASKVIYLSCVDGVYQSLEDPSSLIQDFDGDFDKLREFVRPEHRGYGGMVSKLKSIRLLFDLGIDCYIANGNIENVLRSILLGNVSCTFFPAPKKKKLTGVRKWLCTGAVPKGEIVASDIGADVIRKNHARGSLLAKGVAEVKGSFNKGDVVSVCTEEGEFLGYGISRHSAEDVLSFKGKDNIIVVHADYFYGFDQGYFG